MCGGTLATGSDAAELAWAREDELSQYDLTSAVTRVVRKAFARAYEREVIEKRDS